MNTSAETPKPKFALLSYTVKRVKKKTNSEMINSVHFYVALK